MEWEPEEQAWNSYIKMELRYQELDRARGIYERFVQVEPPSPPHLTDLSSLSLSRCTQR